MSDLAARREARRRKILENSQNRLNKITGNQENTKIQSNTNNECKLNSNLSTDDIISNFMNNDLNTDFANILTNGDINRLIEEDTEQEENQTNNAITKQNDTIIVISLAIFINLLMFICEKYFEIDHIILDSLHLNKIFLPLVLYEIIRISIYQESNNLSWVLLLITNNQSPLIQLILNFMLQLSLIFQHVGIYFVVFISCDICKNFLLFANR